MDKNPFDPSQDHDPADELTPAEPTPEPPTVPGLDQTQPHAQPKWQPLPAGSWGSPGSPESNPPPAWSPSPGGQPAGAAPPPYGAQPPYGTAQPPYRAQPPYGTAQPPYGAQPPDGSPPAGSPYGSPYGYGYGYYGPQPAGPDGGAAQPAPASSRTGRRILTGVVVLALVAAAVTGGALLAHKSPPATSTASQTIPSAAAGNSTAQTKLNVSAVASKIDPATVDITSILSTAAEDEGTGMILTSNGEVLTNNHVIEGSTSITAQVDGKGQKYAVKVIGTDPTDDVALVLLEGAHGLPHVSLGNSSAVKVGDQVVAIGNALGLGGTPTVTSGIISALGRSISPVDQATGASEHLSGMLQTDAPINPGNSGGPLVNSAGQVVGMDTAALTGSGTQSATNIGFAIPIDRALSIAQQIQQHKSSSTIEIGQRGIMGVNVETIAAAEQNAQNFVGGAVNLPVNYGAVVFGVLSGSPAAKAGIADGDVITGLNGKRIASPSALVAALQGDHPGKTISVTWVDGSGQSHSATVTLIAGPAA